MNVVVWCVYDLGYAGIEVRDNVQSETVFKLKLLIYAILNIFEIC